MEQQYVLKTEVESNEEILLFYVDEDGGNEEGVLTTVDNIEQVHGQQVGNTYILGNTEVLTDNADDNEGEIGTLEQMLNTDTWTEEEIKRLLVFYIDNKETFITGAANKTHLWTVACKTMLMGKNTDSCEMKLQEMKTKYTQAYLEYSKGNDVDWTYFVLCHQAFYEETPQQEKFLNEPQTSNVNEVVTSNKSERTSSDYQKVEAMLEIYLKFIKSGAAKGHNEKNIWEIIAIQLGEDGDYWQKRFLNYKQHYLLMLDNRRRSGASSVNWSYMKLFDQITEEEKKNKNKYIHKENTQTTVNVKQEVFDWDDTEITVLVKYYFDCLHEFQDPTIPNNFLWNEVSRLLDRTPEKCKAKYDELKNAHMEKYLLGNYDVRSRKPIAILFDNIIAREVRKEFKSKSVKRGTLSSEETDSLVDFFHDNIELLKDAHCYFVCFACISKKLQRSVQICIKQWHELTVVYCNILNQKREDLDLQIYWKYIDYFDRIFDYGMDIDLLAGYDHLLDENEPDLAQIQAKKLEIDMDEQTTKDKGNSAKHSSGRGDGKALKILQYYLKNKDKFMMKTQKKRPLWEVLANEIGLPATECAHRFRNFKQVFTSYVQREINKPEVPIMWPYYSICKKVFGYRALKSKLRNGRPDSDEEEGWSAKEINQLIDFFEQNYDVLSNSGDIYKWTPLACEIGKTERACNDKFVELRKIYRKLTTVKSRRPDVKVSWKYFNRFHEICQMGDNQNGGDSLNVGDGKNVNANNVVYEQMQVQDPNSDEMQDDIKYIFVIPEGQDPNDLSEAQLISKEELQKVVDMSGVISNENETENMELDKNSDGLPLKTEYIVPELFQSDIPTVTDTPSTTNDEQDNAIHANNDIFVPTMPNDSRENTKKITKWTRKSKRKLLINYLNYIKRHMNQAIVRKDMWVEISMRMVDKSPVSCRKMFLKLKKEHLTADAEGATKKETPYSALLQKILAVKPKFVKISKEVVLEEKMCEDVPLPDEKVQQALEYYYEHIEEFLSPKFDSKYMWSELGKHISEPTVKVFNKVNYLKQNFDRTTGEVSTHSDILTKIMLRESELKSRDKESNGLTKVYRDEQSWTEDEIEQLLTGYLVNLDKFKNPKFARSYLWVEVSDRLKRTPLECSKKMSEIRTQYRTMVNEKTEELLGWRFYDLCQKIYGTGKKGLNI